ncbi:MAG: hypothetical protein HY273_11035 [Gammaproteobacteria bacterium]|nr:hypothetical protein [Gammaproteobacteria bacterium]
MINLQQLNLWSLALCFCCIMPRGAAAYSFDMSETEFSNWPMYCQARYASIDVGKAHAFSVNFSRALIEQAREQLGAETFERVHHWCAGMTWLNRSRLERDPKMREFQLDSAKSETMFTYKGLPADSSIVPGILVTLGMVCQEQKDFTCASDNFEKAITASPKDPSPYSALALLHRKNKQLALARDVLLRGDTALQGKSAEIHYNLGLILLEMSDVDGALNYAQKAYVEGYPLPGLKKKLSQIGRWVEPTPEATKPPQAAQSTTATTP